MNAPQGDTDDSPKAFTGDEIDDLLEGARLDRFSAGTGEHAGNVMACFVRDDGREIGITFSTASTYDPDMIGGTYLGMKINDTRMAARLEREPGALPRDVPMLTLKKAGRIEGGDAVILLDAGDDVDQITVRETKAFGLYDVTPDTADVEDDGVIA